MTGSFTYLAFFTEVGSLVKIIVALVMLYGAVFILSHSSRVTQ